MPPPRPIVLLGPTAGGKSDLAVALAERLDAVPGEVIGADSMQVYRGMDAGTAKPTRAQRARVRHHLIDIVEPAQRFTVADWLALAEPLIADLQVRGVRPIIVGGTNLYLKALLEGMFEGPGHEPALRAELGLLGGPELHARLTAVDPAAADRIHPNDQKKLIRALEVFALTGRPMSAWQTQWDGELGLGPGGESGLGSGVRGLKSVQTTSAGRRLLGSGETPDPRPHTPRTYRHDPILIGLDWPAEAINQRINHRVKLMFFPGPAPPGESAPESLPDEARRLERAGALGIQAREALGYKQVLDAHAVGNSMDYAMERTKIATRQLARRQRTWLKRFHGVHWIPAADRPFDAVLSNAIAAVRADLSHDATA